MSDHDWQELAGVIGIFVLITTVLTVTIWQLAATWRAKAALSREQAYRELVEKAVQGQERTARQLSELDGTLTDLRTRLASVEKILKEVE